MSVVHVSSSHDATQVDGNDSYQIYCPFLQLAIIPRTGQSFSNYCQSAVGILHFKVCFKRIIYTFVVGDCH